MAGRAQRGLVSRRVGVGNATATCCAQEWVGVVEMVEEDGASAMIVWRGAKEEGEEDARMN